MIVSIARLLAVITLILSASFISGCSSGGSVDPGGPGDNGELTLDYCEVVEIDNQMHVQWSANHATRGEFRYGLSSLVQITDDPDFANEHDVMLIGLQFDTAYIYELTVTDSAGNTAVCDGDFTTPLKATPEPIIMNLEISNITESQAVVRWITDELAITILYYGEQAATDSVVIAGYNFEHEVTLMDLNVETVYAVRPEAVDLDGLRGFGPDSSFSTAARLMVWFDDVTMALGETTDVAIHLEGAQDLGALQYRLQFEDTVGAHSANGAIHILDLRAGPFTASELAPLFFQDIRNGQRFISNEMAWLIEYDGNERVGTTADGSGVIAIMKVRAIREGDLPSVFDEQDSYGLDMFGVQRACSLQTGVISIHE
jgi:hypothetical protein